MALYSENMKKYAEELSNCVAPTAVMYTLRYLYFNSRITDFQKWQA